MRSKQWYTKTSRLPNSFVNVSIGHPPQIRSCQHDHRSDGRWSQNFKYVWLVLNEQIAEIRRVVRKTDFSESAVPAHRKHTMSAAARRRIAAAQRKRWAEFRA